MAVGVYNSPNTTEDIEEALFKEMKRLSDTSRLSSHLLVTGDFNYKGIDWVTILTWHVRPGADETKCINFLECVRDTLYASTRYSAYESQDKSGTIYLGPHLYK